MLHKMAPITIALEKKRCSLIKCTIKVHTLKRNVQFLVLDKVLTKDRRLQIQLID